MSPDGVLGRGALPAHPLHASLGSRTRAGMSRIRVALASMGLVSFAALAVVAHRAPPLPVDLQITRALQTLHGPWIEVPLGALSAIGFPPTVGLLYGSVVVLLFLLGARRHALAAAVATGGAAVLHRLAADWVSRARPTPDLVHVAHSLPIHSSFPAGHVQ